MTERFTLSDEKYDGTIFDDGKSMGCIDIVDMLNALNDENEQLRTKNNAYIQDIEVFKEENTHLKLENEQLKSQLYCDDEEGVCNICKHHYLIKDDEAELGYYNSRCKKGHYECARVSLKYCEDFEKEL